jgi:hypothetical protein
MMPETIDCIIEGTDAKTGEFNYQIAIPDTPDTKQVQGTTWQYSVKVQSVSTSRTSGEIKLRIAAREMPETTRMKSTR